MLFRGRLILSPKPYQFILEESRINTLQISKRSQIIKDPLWDLMLSTNDCYPSCSCDDDFFEITLARIYPWIRHNGNQNAQQALAQLDELINSVSLDIESLSAQTNLVMLGKDDVVNWLSDWRSILSEVESIANYELDRK